MLLFYLKYRETTERSKQKLQWQIKKIMLLSKYAECGSKNATKYFVVKGINMLKRLTQIEGSGITLTNNAIKDIKESGP